MDQRSGDGWFSVWFQNLRHQQEEFKCRILKYSMRGLLQRWTKSSIILTSKEESVWRNKRHKKRTVSFVEDRSLTWSTNTSGSLEPMIPSRIIGRLIYNCSSKWWYSGIQLKVGLNFIVDDTNPIWWHLGRIVHIKNTRVWETQDRIGIVQYGIHQKKARTWLSQIEDNGEKKYRAESTNQEFWDQKWKLWEERRGQESGDKRAWTKNSWRLLAMGSQWAVCKRRQLKFPPRYQ